MSVLPFPLVPLEITSSWPFGRSGVIQIYALGTARPRLEPRLNLKKNCKIPKKITNFLALLPTNHQQKMKKITTAQKYQNCHKKCKIATIHIMWQNSVQSCMYFTRASTNLHSCTFLYLLIHKIVHFDVVFWWLK